MQLNLIFVIFLQVFRTDLHHIVSLFSLYDPQLELLKELVKILTVLDLPSIRVDNLVVYGVGTPDRRNCSLGYMGFSNSLDY